MTKLIFLYMFVHVQLVTGPTGPNVTLLALLNYTPTIDVESSYDVARAAFGSAVPIGSV
jgi:hypothetical protein